MILNLVIIPVRTITVSGETTIVASGTCGPNAHWTLDNTGAVRVTGFGEMDNYELGSSPFYEYRDQIKSITFVGFPEGVTSVGNYAFTYCDNLTSISLPEGVTRIGTFAFSECINLKTLTIPESVETIESYAFYFCRSLTNLILPDGLKRVSSYMLYGCDSLKSISLPESVNSIGTYAFSMCKNLTRIVISEGVTSIEYGAFNNIGDSLQFVVVENSYAHKLIKSRWKYSYLIRPSNYNENSFLSFKELYSNVKPFEAKSLAEFINHSHDIFFSNITFSVSDESIAMISDGKIVGLEEGSCIIHASYENQSDSFTLLVSKSDNDFDATGITLNKSTLNLNKGHRAGVKATVEPVTATEREVTWISSDMSVVMVENGLITAIAPGTATVTASIHGYSDSMEVTVYAPLLALAVDNEDVVLRKDEIHKIYTYHYPYDTTDDKTVTYSSSDESIATVDSKGFVRAVGNGTAKILISNGSFETSVNVTTVTSLNGVSLNRTSITGIKNTSELLFVSYDPIDTTDDKTVTWTSSNPSAASVDSSGLVSFISRGITTITAMVGNYSASCTVIVVEIPLQSISLNHTEAFLYYEETLKLSLSYEPSNTTDAKSIIWTSSDESIATVNMEGVVTGIGKGNAIITATTEDGNKKASCKITVEAHIEGAHSGVTATRNHKLKCEICGEEYGELISIRISKLPAELEYVVGQYLDLSSLVVTGTFNDGTEAVLHVTTNNITGFDSSAPVKGQEVTVNIEGKTATFNVDILGKTITIAGPNRYGTAVEISKASYEQAEVAVLVQARNFPDALAAGPLAYMYNAPILLTNTNSVSGTTMAELERLGVKKIILMGGEGAISSTVENSLVSEGYEIERIAGSNRYNTAVLTAKAMEEKSGKRTKIVLASGNQFADALAAGSFAAKEGYPILLTSGTTLNTMTKEYLAGVEEVILVGGSGVINDNVKMLLEEMGIKVTRKNGVNRSETSTVIGREYFSGSNKAIIANGWEFADALAAAPYAAKVGAPIILVNQNRVSSSIVEYISGSSIRSVTIVGGDAAVGNEVKNILINLLQEK